MKIINITGNTVELQGVAPGIKVNPTLLTAEQLEKYKNVADVTVIMGWSDAKEAEAFRWRRFHVPPE